LFWALPTDCKCKFSNPYRAREAYQQYIHNFLPTYFVIILAELRLPGHGMDRLIKIHTSCPDLNPYQLSSFTSTTPIMYQTVNTSVPKSQLLENEVVPRSTKLQTASPEMQTKITRRMNADVFETLWKEGVLAKMAINHAYLLFNFRTMRTKSVRALMNRMMMCLSGVK
jgi:hypothetical protein